MNQYILQMLKKGIIIGGKLSYDNGYAIFQRLDLKEIEDLSDDELAFATKSMGRAVFKLTQDGRIINYKGVDSHLDNKAELAIQDLVEADTISISDTGGDYQNVTYPINLAVYPGNRPDIRFRGAAHLEDLEIEAFINARLKKMGIKVPEITEIKEFTEEFSKKCGLPIKIKGSYDDLQTDYRNQNNERKKRLHEIYGEVYFEDVPKGLRAEMLSEYFSRVGLLERNQIKGFLEKHKIAIDKVIQHVDIEYSMGQRYGQSKRKIESPFRIADLESFVKAKDIDSLNLIAMFTESTQDEKENFENIYARQMGVNIGNLMNNGWCLENFVHRQDYTLIGEMCDDSYYDLRKRLQEEREKPGMTEGKYKETKEEKTTHFLSQVLVISSTIKVLQDEMKLRGKSQEEIDSVLEDFISQFVKTIDIKKIAESLNKSQEEILLQFKKIFLETPNFTKKMAEQKRKNKETEEIEIKYDEQILRAHEGYEKFYKKVGDRMVQELNFNNQKCTFQKIGEGTVNAFLEDPEKATNLFSLLVNAIQGIKNKMERG